MDFCSVEVLFIEENLKINLEKKTINILGVKMIIKKHFRVSHVSEEGNPFKLKISHFLMIQNNVYNIRLN